MRRWLQCALPDRYQLAAVLVVLGCTAAMRWLAWRYFARYGEDSQEFVGVLDQTVLAMAALVAVVCGLVRVYLREPLIRRDYFQWLRATPWTASRPLPLGNLFLDHRDALFVGLLTAVMLPTSAAQALWPLTFYLLAYLASLSVLSLSVHARGYSYWLLFGCGLALWMRPWSPWSAAGTALVFLVPAWLGVAIHLRRLPFWEPKTPADLFRETISKAPWPYCQLHGVDLAPKWSRRDRVAAALLAGWAVFVGMSFIHGREPHEPMDGTAFILFFVTCGFAALRTSHYMLGYLPANGLLRRWTTGRPVDPAYDQVLVVPALLVLMATALPWAICSLAPAYIPLVSAIYVSAVGLLTFFGGPSKSGWQATCPAKLVFAENDKRKFEQI